jgi:hypothetical protein
VTRAKPPELVKAYDDEVARARAAGSIGAAELVDVAAGRRLALALSDEATPPANLPALATALHAVRRRLGLAPEETSDADLAAFLASLNPR